ncbi:fibronectin type III domain-containing protein [Streptomyces sp. NPDC048448]|uniref:fibronectin type III domain-containing protein n=1 Tax=Streptomyces sp. NPDC048448 TaxID=3365554 RepID=UPI00371FB8AC
MGPVMATGPAAHRAHSARKRSRPVFTATALIATACGLLTAGAVPASAATVSCASPVYKRQFFSNTTFSGTPRKTDCDAQIDENWGAGVPAPGLPKNTFGVRWTVTRDFGSGGPFALSAASRDGIRVYLDGTRRVDLWKDVSTTQKKTVNITVPSGTHTLRVDFVNWTGDANVTFAYAPRTSATVDKVKPLTPGGASLSYADGRAKLTWSRNKEMDLAGYQVYRRLKGTDFGSKPLATTTSTSYTDTSLPLTGDVYYYEVRAYDRAGNVSTGTADKAVTTLDRTPPAAPAGLSVARTDGAVRTQWQPVKGASWYRVYRASSAAGPFEAVSAELTDSSYRDTPSFDVTKRWYYRVVAGDTAGNKSAPSAIADTGAPDVTPPAQVVGVQAVGSTAGNNVRWSANADDTAHYEVWARPAGEQEFAGPQIVFGPSWLDTTAPVGGTIEYRVHAVDAAGNISPVSASAEAVRPAPAPVSAPQPVTVSPRDSDTVLEWAFPGTDAWHFHVYRRTDPNGAWTLLNDVATGANMFQDATAPEGVSYYYVASVDSAGADSAPSPTVTVDRLTQATPTAPQVPLLSLKAPYTECTANDCAGHGGTGQSVTVTMSRQAGDDRVIGGYQWRVYGATDTGYHRTSDTTVTWTPTKSGLYVAEVATVDVYGRVGPSTHIEFKVG